MSSSSNSGLLISLGALGLYGYTVYSLVGPQVAEAYSLAFPLNEYGVFRFLTNQCALIQLVNALLHVLAHFIKPLRGPRDLVFSTLAFPVGAIVVFTFWLVCYGMGREAIFPAVLDNFYPAWLNHATHTVIVPINLLLALLVNHKYYKYGTVVTTVYLSAYIVFLHVVKAKTGLFIYRYLNDMDDIKLVLNYVFSAMITYLMYELGSLVTRLVYGRGQQAVTTKKSKGHKQK
uniref:Androgen-induced gene 1 protein n=1 Tax=Aceria tosichella TaxID=561515 RepID=A0A6G1S7R2_9ACAR